MSWFRPRYKIVKNPPIKKIDRKLTLEKFFTFANGHSIYTYQIEDLTHLSGRYLDQIKQTINFCIQYNAGPDQIKKFCEAMGKIAKDAIDNKTDRSEALIQVLNHSREMPKLSEYVESLDNKMWLDLYVMFFVLGDEPETAFSPKHNKRKIEYLNTCTEEEQESFFLFLKDYTLRLSTTYREDTLSSLIKEGEMLSLVDSLLRPMNTLSSLSKLPDTQEPISTN